MRILENTKILLDLHYFEMAPSFYSFGLRAAITRCCKVESMNS